MGLDLPKHRNKGLGEGALRKEAAQEVGKTESNKESVGLGTRPEEACGEDFSDQAGDPGEQGEPADSGDGLE